MSFGFSPGSRKTGTMIRATFVVPSRWGRSARPMFSTISTWDPRVSAKQIGGHQSWLLDSGGSARKAGCPTRRSRAWLLTMRHGGDGMN